MSRCPGRQEGGRAVHIDGCCAQFVLMSPERRAVLTGRPLAPRRLAGPRRTPPAPEEISVPQLVDLIKKMQARAAQFPDEEPPGATVAVEYGPPYTLDDILALYDLGRPYNLVLGYRGALDDNPLERNSRG